MDDSSIETVAQLRRLLSASKDLRLKSASGAEKYAWVEAVLKRFKFHSQGRKAKGLIRKYIRQMTGISTSQLTRLISRHLLNGTLEVTVSRVRNCFSKTYTLADIELLADTDNLHNRLSGPATRRIFEVEYRAGDQRYARLVAISPSHIYNLREAKPYLAKASHPEYRTRERDRMRKNRALSVAKQVMIGQKGARYLI